MQGVHCARSADSVARIPRALDQLPDDITTLKRLLIERDAEVQAKRNELIAARLMIERLQIARYRRLQSGRKSERHVAQLELLAEELETSLAAAADRSQTSPATAPGRICRARTSCTPLPGPTAN